MRSRLILVTCLSFLLAIIHPAMAQDITPEAVAAPTSEPITLSPVVTDSPQQILAEAERVLAEAKSYAAEARDATGMGFNLLNLFQLVGILLAGIGLIGFRSYQTALNRLEADKTKIMEELQQTRHNLEQEIKDRLSALDRSTQTQLANNLKQYSKKSENISVALSLLPIGNQQYRVQDFSGAAFTYGHALELDPDNPVANYRLGYVYVLLGEMEKAQHYLSRSLEIDPHFLPAKAARGYVYRRQAETITDDGARKIKFNEAETELLNVLNTSPKLVDEDGQSWWGALGSLYRQRGQYPDAIDAYKKAMLVTPYSSYPFGNLARIYMQQGNYPEMERLYERVERLAGNKAVTEPENYWWYTDLLYARLVLDKDGQAKEAAIQGIFNTLPIESPYAVNALLRTLNRLAEGLESYKPDRAANIREVCKQIEDHFKK